MEEGKSVDSEVAEYNVGEEELLGEGEEEEVEEITGDKIPALPVEEDTSHEPVPFLKPGRLSRHHVLYVVRECAMMSLDKEMKCEPEEICVKLKEITLNIKRRLVDLKKLFKFVVSVDVCQQVGAGMDVSMCANWEKKTDNYVRYKWANKEILLWIVVIWAAH